LQQGKYAKIDADQGHKPLWFLLGHRGWDRI
jgi:hypothetical protein